MVVRQPVEITFGVAGKGGRGAKTRSAEDCCGDDARSRTGAKPGNDRSRQETVVCVKFSKLVMVRVRCFAQVNRASSLC